MFKAIITDAVISKGFDGAPALRYNEGDSMPFVRFRIGKRKYDKRVEGNYRWVNIGVKAFGNTCERIRNMKLDAGSFVTIIADYDEDSWVDSETGKQVTVPVLIVDEIEYCYNGGNKSESNASASKGSAPVPESPAAAKPTSEATAPAAKEMPEGFTGYESFGGKNPFFSDEE